MVYSFLKKWFKIFSLISLFFFIRDCFCDESYSWDFSDCEIKDILYSISIDTGISIVPDDTVNGKGDFKFSGGNFSKAFDSFLKSVRLYVKKEDKLWTVSKFNFECVNDLYFIDGYDLYPKDLVEKISENVNWVITYDSLPSEELSVHFKGLTKNDLILNLSKRFGNYEISENKNGFHFKKKIENKNFEYNNSNIEIIFNKNNLEKLDSISVDVKDASFFDVVEKLFAEFKSFDSNISYCFLCNNDTRISRSFFVGKKFEDTLNILCGQNCFKVVKNNDIFYIVDDNTSKENIVYGNKKWQRFSLNYISTDDVLALLTKRLKNIEIIPLLDKTSFLCNCNEEESSLINDFIKQTDIKKNVHVINLRFIKPEEFLEYLPPIIDKNNLFFADNNSRLYFRGTEEAYKNIIEQIKIVDIPAKKISYDLLILQYDENHQNSWMSSIGARKLEYGERSNGTALLGSVLGLNLNVVAAFGVNFAAELQASIEENNTRVFADTTLQGVSGKQISFQNTNTYRYRDNNVNPENGKPIYSGVTKEIITGIKIDVLGWVSGDGIITTNVTASVSRQGNDTSSATGNPPPTSEKLVTTEVSGKSGEPVILSGLVLDAESESEKGSPLISKIPIIGNLFKSKNKNHEKSQMVIYLVPHILDPTEITKEQLFCDDWFISKINDLKIKINKKEVNYE